MSVAAEFVPIRPAGIVDDEEIVVPPCDLTLIEGLNHHLATGASKNGVSISTRGSITTVGKSGKMCVFSPAEFVNDHKAFTITWMIEGLASKAAEIQKWIDVLGHISAEKMASIQMALLVKRDGQKNQYCLLSLSVIKEDKTESFTLIVTTNTYGLPSSLSNGNGLWAACPLTADQSQIVKKYGANALISAFHSMTAAAAAAADVQSKVSCDLCTFFPNRRHCTHPFATLHWGDGFKSEALWYANCNRCGCYTARSTSESKELQAAKKLVYSQADIATIETQQLLLDWLHAHQKTRASQKNNA